MTEITVAFATSAFYGTSFSPERRGESFVKDVREHLDYVAQWLGRWRTDDNSREMNRALSYYNASYTEKARAYLSAHSRCISSFIAGPSGFPVERARKANDRADKRMLEWLEWGNKQRERMRRQFDPASLVVISADDEDAIAQLQAKRDRLMQLQELYKEANKVCRKPTLNDDEKAAAMSDLGLDDKAIHAALHPQWGKAGFKPYVLSNNNANIKRIEDRIKSLEREAAHRASGPNEYEINGVRVLEDDDDNRLKLFFDGKPAQTMIDSLKAHGFHWSPNQKCWMRQLNGNARYAMREVLQ